MPNILLCPGSFHEGDFNFDVGLHTSYKYKYCLLVDLYGVINIEYLLNSSLLRLNMVLSQYYYYFVFVLLLCALQNDNYEWLSYCSLSILLEV